LDRVPLLDFDDSGAPLLPCTGVDVPDCEGLWVLRGFLYSESVESSPLQVSRYVNAAAQKSELYSWAGADGDPVNEEDVGHSRKLVFCAPKGEISRTTAAWLKIFLQSANIVHCEDTFLRDMGKKALTMCGIPSTGYLFSHSNHTHSILPPHADLPNMSGGYGKHIVTLNVRGRATLVIYTAAGKPLYAVRLEAGDCYVMSGHVRHKLLHGVFPDCIASGACWSGCGSCRLSVNCRFSQHSAPEASELDKLHTEED
jgi:hypothetical protein